MLIDTKRWLAEHVPPSPNPLVDFIRVGPPPPPQGCRDISRYAIHRDIFYISRYFFGHIAIQMYMRYTEIDGRIDGERRKYTRSHHATSVGPHTYSRIPLRCCVHIYCKLSAPIEIKISRPYNNKYHNKYHTIHVLFPEILSRKSSRLWR